MRVELCILFPIIAQSYKFVIFSIFLSFEFLPEIEECSSNIILAMLINRVRHIGLRHSTGKWKTMSVAELIKRFEKYIGQEEFEIVFKDKIPKDWSRPRSPKNMKGSGFFWNTMVMCTVKTLVLTTRVISCVQMQIML